MSSGVARTKAGSYYGTGAAKTLAEDIVGFKPKRLTIYRMSTDISMVEHVEGMAAASGLLTTGSTGVRTLVTTEMVTLTDTGFTLGTNAQVNGAADLFHFFAEE